MNGTLNGTLPNELSEIERNIIGELLINPHLTQQEIADKLGIGRRTVVRYMAALQDKKIIVKDGSKRDGYWKILK